MAEEIILNNYSDDSKIKQYISEVLMPRVFHDIPLNVLNTGHFSIINEYMSQALEQQSYTASFFFNESFITKAVLPDSIYAEAAIFDIGYSFATPSSCQFLLELKIEDIYNNATLNPDTGLYEFILDKNTKFNLSNGNVYSLDYDILIQYKNIETSNRSATIPAWNVQYTNLDSTNYVAKNKNVYITYRVTDVWLCLLVQASEYEREVHTVVNNMTNGIPNGDKVITCNNHIAGFDVKYIDGNGNEQFLPRDHILPIHSNVTDNDPYIHYIMDNPQTIRFMFQLNGNKYFVPKLNSSFEITIYTCHGESANFTAFKNDEQPQVITSSNKYSNNANVMKAAFVISGSVGGTNIGTIETTRRETIEAYNTANVISSDHDIDEWFKTFFFKNILYPFFFKRRDDPWGRIWSGYMALKDTDDYVFRTNTLHCKIPYEVLYNNNDNTVSSNEIIIPPGWIWIYGDENRYTIIPYTKGDGVTVETAKTLSNISEKFIFSNPFGIRIQKQPFAIGYFNPWVNDYVTATKVTNFTSNQVVDNNNEDISYIYHATPLITNIRRTYQNNYYNITTYISPTISAWSDGSELVKYVRQNAVAPVFSTAMWNYFKEPLDLYSSSIPILPLTEGNGYIPFNPEKTYFCVRTKNRISDDKWVLSDIWIDDLSEIESKRVFIPITGEITMLYGTDVIWGDKGLWNGHEVFVSGDIDIGIYPEITDEDPIQFERIASQNYYEMRLRESVNESNNIRQIVVGEAIKTELTKYGETQLTKIGKSYASSTYINVYFANGITRQYTITNAANIYMPYDFYVDEYGQYVFDLSAVGAGGIILYTDMRPAPDSGAIDYYRIPFSSIPENTAMFYIANKLLPMEENNMRVVLHAMINGSESGRVEMQPVKKEDDGSYRFEVDMYPLNQLVDVDNRINIASTENGGGSWISTTSGSVVNVDATEPEFMISILIRSEDSMRDSEISIGDSFTGFRLVDQYTLDDVALVQELKEMRSVVNFGESSTPTDEQKLLYDNMLSLCEYDESVDGNIKTLTDYAYKRMKYNLITINNDKLKQIAKSMKTSFDNYVATYNTIVTSNTPSCLKDISDALNDIISDETSNGYDIDWSVMWKTLYSYRDSINESFDKVNINGGVEVQLVPFVEYSLMNSDRFTSFVSSFTQIHEALEPVILHRLEGNNYLDCKLIATYGLPHSYSSDVDYELENVFWPDLNVQVEFDVKLYNASLATNTINELRLIVKSYFNRLTSIHTPVDLISMDNNIYVSHLIQQMEEHSNVAYMKFIGWYTNEKNDNNGNYMDANTQAICQKWRKLEDFPKEELERFTPEMFVLEDKNIVINIIQ
jgi:hypothetical protein